VFVLKLSPCVFRVPFHCADQSKMLLFTDLFRSAKTWQWYLILYDFVFSFFVCYVSDEVVSSVIVYLCITLLNANIFCRIFLLIYDKETL